jgi:small subunit ribosomal protein S4
MPNTTTPPQVTSAYSTDQNIPKRAPTGRTRKVSDFGRQLGEKQKAKQEYGLREAQFRRYFSKAMKSSLATGQALFIFLERRLDNVVYRTGLAKTRRMARQLVSHGLIQVNGQRVTMPSYAVREGETIELLKNDAFEYNKDVIIPDWLSYNAKKKIAKVERLPKVDDIVTDINSQLIIEYYSR